MRNTRRNFFKIPVTYGKGIINNAKTKIVLNLEDEEAQRVQDILHLSETETMAITHFERGNGLISTNNNNITVEFKASTLEKELITRLSTLNAKAFRAVEALRQADREAAAAGDAHAVACAFRDKVVPAMASLRAPVDEMETLMPSKLWPLPTYGEMTYQQ